MKKQAFTLTEILISLGIIGVLMALSASIIKPREIQFKYQYQQAQTNLSDATREAILRTTYTHHRFPKETINGVVPVMQLCRGLNETLNTTVATHNIDASVGDIGDGKKGCIIRTLTGMTFYIESQNNGKPICRRHTVDNGTGTSYTVDIGAYVVYVDLDGRGGFYDINKATPANYNPNFNLGNYPAFFLDEDYFARPVSQTAQSISTTNCGF